MAKRLNVGSQVLCQLYNTPDGKFYGSQFTARVTTIEENHRFGNFIDTAYWVTAPTHPNFALHRKEIKRIL